VNTRWPKSTRLRVKKACEMQYQYKTDSDSRVKFAENAWGVGKVIRKAVRNMPDNAVWALHDSVAHPVVSTLHFAGLNRAGDWLHDITMALPPSDPNNGLVLTP